MSLARRLEKIESDVTPKQVVMKYLAYMAQHESVDKFMLWALGDESQAIGKQSTNNMYETVKRSLKGRDAVAINQAISQVSNEYSFLFEIALAPSRRVAIQEYRHKFLFSTLIIMHSRVMRIAFEKCPEMSEDEKIEYLDKTKVLMLKALSIMLADKLFAERVSNQYFEGCSMLFKEQQEHLDRQVSLTKRLCEQINDDIDFLEYTWEQNKQHQDIDCKRFTLDFDEVDTLADSMALDLLAEVKQEATVAVYEAQGKYSQANKVLVSIIRSHST